MIQEIEFISHHFGVIAREAAADTATRAWRTNQEQPMLLFPMAGSPIIAVRFSIPLSGRLQITCGSKTIANMVLSSVDEVAQIALLGDWSGPVGRIDQAWVWSINDEVWATTRHTFYRVVGVPGAPWSMEARLARPWIQALDIACAWAAGATSIQEVCQKISDALWEDAFNQKITYISDIKNNFFCQGEYLELHRWLNNRRGKQVHCFDIANIFILLSNLLGGEFLPQRIAINKAPLVRGWFVGSQTLSPLRFNVHCVAVDGAGLIYDPTIRVVQDQAILAMDKKVYEAIFPNTTMQWHNITLTIPDPFCFDEDCIPGMMDGLCLYLGAKKCETNLLQPSFVPVWGSCPYIMDNSYCFIHPHQLWRLLINVHVYVSSKDARAQFSKNFPQATALPISEWENACIKDDELHLQHWNIIISLRHSPAEIAIDVAMWMLKYLMDAANRYHTLT